MLKDKVFLGNLPDKPGIYQMLGASREILYVGKARSLKKRVSSYFSSKVHDLKTQNLIQQADSIEVTITNTEQEALLLECFLIKKHKPRYNVLLRDDKSYPYILITDDKPYPRIMLYRGLKKGKGQYFGPYPNVTAVRETIHIIQKLFHLRSCNDTFFANRKRPCLHYQIGLCSGSCTGLITPADYQKSVDDAVLFLKGKSQDLMHELKRRMEEAAKALLFEVAAKFRDQLTYLEEIQARQYVSSSLNGNADILGLARHAGLACIYLLSIRGGRLLGNRSYFPSLPGSTVSSEIVSAFISQHYLGVEEKEMLPQEIIIAELIDDGELLEKALSEKVKAKVSILKPMRGERRKWLEMAESNAKQALASQLIQKTNIEERLLALQEALNLKSLPQRIECFDISHSGGEETVASCVVFNREGPAKSDYRRFNISGITPGDDVAAMGQALSRRFKRLQSEGKALPDLILIDGGMTQLAAAEKALEALDLHGLLLVGVAKGVERKPGLETLYFSNRTSMHLPKDSIALHFIQQIRDEAHRFAITGHRGRRDKKRRTSVLEAIPGIGAKRRRALLKHFGGLQAIEAANIDQIAAVSGITPALAEQIYQHFHS
jgi:excinuclease ABC subunit C